MSVQRFNSSQFAFHFHLLIVPLLIVSGSCRDVQTCNLQQWTSWSGHVANGHCGRQQKYRRYIEQNVRYREQNNNCNGIRKSCPSSEYNYRTLCKL